MKNNLAFAILFTSVLGISCNAPKPNVSEKNTAAKNAKKEEMGIIDEEVAGFLVRAADARMMNIKQGTLAVSRGTSVEIKNYGRLMQKEQAKMMAIIKTLAKSRNITLPQTISAAKQDGFNGLNAKNGKEFDEKFIKMMKIDHARDAKDFKNANDFKDNKIKEFANEYLPMIQAHLDKINAIKEN